MAFARFRWVGKCVCAFVSQFIFSSADRCIWIKTKIIDYKRAKKKMLRRTCEPREDGVSNVG